MANPLIRWINQKLNLAQGGWTTFFGSSTYAGKSIDPETSLQSTAVWACARVITEAVGSLPVSVFEKQGSGRKMVKEGHQVHWLLHHSPAKHLTPVEFKESMTLNLVLWGNAYAEIARTGTEVSSLTPLLAQTMEAKRLDDGSIVYQYWDGQQVVVYDSSSILHIKLFGWNGIMGLSPVSYCRQAIGLALTAEEFGARIFSQGALPGALIKFKGRLTKEKKDELQENISDLLEGVSRAGRVAVIGSGDNWEYQQISINPLDAQFLETRQFQVEEIARIFRLPRHMIQDLERATFSNIEHQEQEFVTYCLMPYLVRWEEAVNKALFRADEPNLFAKFNMEALARGDMQARSVFYSSALQNGWMSRNEVRDKEDMDRSEQDGADDLTVQSNMIDLDKLGGISDQPTRATQTEAA